MLPAAECPMLRPHVYTKQPHPAPDLFLCKARGCPRKTAPDAALPAGNILYRPRCAEAAMSAPLSARRCRDCRFPRSRACSPESSDSVICTVRRPFRHRLLQGHVPSAVQQSALQDMPEDFSEYMKQYRMGQRFSHLAYVVQLRFNHIMAMFNEQKDEADKLQAKIEEIMEQYPSDFTSQAIGDMLFFIQSRVTEQTVITFCRESVKLIEKRDWVRLDELIVAREKAVKPGRNKLRNPKYKGEERGWPSMLSFRWNEIVYQVINEIREAK